MRINIVAAAAAFALSTSYSLTAFSQAKPETLVEQRQAAMTLQAKYLFPLVPMAQGRVPFDAATVARNAAYLDVLIKMPWDGFVPSTEGVKNTRALPAIYKDEAKFKAAQERTQAEVSKLVVVSKSGNEANIKAQITQTVNACNSCHDSFRAKR
jgi:cytochrome c556